MPMSPTVDCERLMTQKAGCMIQKCTLPMPSLYMRPVTFGYQ